MKLPRRQFLHLAAGAAALPAVSRIATAQNYPLRPVRLIVGFAPGGPSDLVARVLGDKLSETLGKPVVVENVSGAAGNIAADRVAKAAPDGYTLLLTASAAIVVNPSLYQKLPFDPLKDFAPITEVAYAPNILLVHNDLPVRNVQELVALARSQPGKLTFASGGVGTSNHLSGELFKSMARIDIQHVPYRGVTQAVPDLLVGRITMAFVATPVALPLVRDGQLRALAVTSLKRASAALELPTMAESGLPGFNSTVWYGLMAPAGTSVAIVDTIHRETIRNLALPDLRRKLDDLGTEIIGNTPAEFAAVIKSEISQWAKVIKEAGIKPE